jgi:DNA-binding NtrC family response regulator
MQDPQSAGTVLVVDDEESVRRSTARLLRRAGLEVLEAASAGEALAFDGTDVDVVLSDVVMPDVNGIELASRLHSVWPHVEVLLISAFTPSALIRHELLAGDSTRILQKPLERSELVAIVTAAVQDAARRRAA